MIINILHGEPKDKNTYAWLSDVQAHLAEINNTLQKTGQWGLFYTHRLDENETGDNILVYPAEVDGNQVLASLIDLVMDMQDRGAIQMKGNKVAEGLSVLLHYLYNGVSTSEITSMLAKLESRGKEQRNV